MKHTLALVLMVFGIVGCASVEFLLEPRLNNQKYDSWAYEEGRDEFKGNYYVSSVISDDRKGRLRVISFEDTNDHMLEYKNGDSYICVIDYSIGIKFKFVKGKKENLIESYMYALEDKSGLGTRSPAAIHNYVQWLHYAEKLIVRTTDDCGNTIDRTFNILGTTHLTPVINP